MNADVSWGSDAAGSAIAVAWREERPRVLASLTRRLGDPHEAEDAVQDAFAAAAARWPDDGVPERPGAWLTTTAWRKALDARRRRPVPIADAEPGRSGVAASGVQHAVTEDQLLAMLLTCCHPALSPEAQVALTLRHVAGLSDEQIAAMFVLPPATMTKRLVRARAKIRLAGIGFGVADRARLTQRLEEVRTVVYLLFTAGYSPSVEGPVVHADICNEAVWLALQLHRLLPEDDETTGLAALLLLQNSRAAARCDRVTSELVSYSDQDRTQWDRDAIAMAKALLATTAGTPPGPYRLEAAIALVHATAADPAAPDWIMIGRLYDILLARDPRPVVAVNRAMAHSRVHGPRHGLHLLQPHLDDSSLRGYLPLHVARAQLLTECANPTARSAWAHAASLATTSAQRRHLEERGLVSPLPRRARQHRDGLRDRSAVGPR